MYRQELHNEAEAIFKEAMQGTLKSPHPEIAQAMLFKFYRTLTRRIDKGLYDETTQHQSAEPVGEKQPPISSAPPNTKEGGRGTRKPAA